MLLGGCQTTGLSATDVSAVGRAPFCDVVKGLDLRASRKDTAATQRVLYQLQQAEQTCHPS